MSHMQACSRQLHEALSGCPRCANRSWQDVANATEGLVSKVLCSEQVFMLCFFLWQVKSVNLPLRTDQDRRALCAGSKAVRSLAWNIGRHIRSHICVMYKVMSVLAQQALMRGNSQHEYKLSAQVCDTHQQNRQVLNPSTYSHQRHVPQAACCGRQTPTSTGMERLHWQLSAPPEHALPCDALELASNYAARPALLPCLRLPDRAHAAVMVV